MVVAVFILTKLQNLLVYRYFCPCESLFFAGLAGNQGTDANVLLLARVSASPAEGAQTRRGRKIYKLLSKSRRTIADKKMNGQIINTVQVLILAFKIE